MTYICRYLYSNPTINDLNKTINLETCLAFSKAPDIPSVVGIELLVCVKDSKSILLNRGYNKRLVISVKWHK